MANKDDDLVISVSTDLTTVRRQLRELGQSVTQSTSGYGKSFEDFGKRMDSAINTTGVQKRINDLTGVVQKSGKEWQGALANVPAELDAIRKKFYPLYEAEQKHLAVLREIETAQAVGALTANKAAQAVANQNAAYSTSVIAIRKGQAAVDDTTKSFKLNRAGLLELKASGVNAFQALASGMSLARVAEMEGAQVIGAFAQGTEGGFKGLVTSAVGLATKFPLATAAIAAAGVAVAAYATVGGNDIKSLDEILKAHEANIKRLGDAYEKVAGKQQNYASLTARSVGALNDKDLQDAKNLLASQIKGIFDSVYKTIGAGGGNQGPLQRVLMSQFEPFKQALSDLANTSDVKTFIDKLDAIAEANPALSSARDALKSMALAAADTAAKLPNLAKGVDQVADAVAQMNDALTNGAGFSQLSDEQTKFVQDLIEKLKNGQISAEDLKAALNGLNGITPDFSGAISQVSGLADQLERAQKAALGLANTTPKEGRIGVNPFDAAQKQYDAAFSLASRIGIDGITPDSTKLPSTPRTPIPRRTADDHFAEDIKSIQARTMALAQERGMLGATYEEQTRLTTSYDLTQKALKEVREEARKKGDQDWQNAQLTPDQIAQINATSEAYAEQAAALKKARDEMQEASEASRDFAQTFIDDMISGKSAAESLGDALKQLGKRLEDLALDSIFGGGNSGSGLFGQLFGSLFGGGGGGGGSVDPWLGMRANGGPVTAGMPYIVGEKRPELFVPRTSGTIIPRIPSIQSGGASGGSTNMNLSITVAGTGDKELVANMTAAASVVVHKAIAENNKALPGKVANLNKKPRMR